MLRAKLKPRILPTGELHKYPEKTLYEKSNFLCSLLQALLETSYFQNNLFSYTSLCN